jgi:hypothetical protein
MTTETTDVTIPPAAVESWFTCGCSEDCGRAGYQHEALAIVVAAELRRLADDVDDMRMQDTPANGDPAVYAEVRALGRVRDLLTARADELDPRP